MALSHRAEGPRIGREADRVRPLHAYASTGLRRATRFRSAGGGELDGGVPARSAPRDGQSEAFGLRWSDIDLVAGSLAVRQSLAPIRAADRAKGIASGQLRLDLGTYPEHLGRLIPLEPKTRHSKTTLPLTVTGVRLLSAHYQAELVKMASAGPAWLGGDDRLRQGYVWTTALGMPITPSKFVLRHFKPLCLRAGIPTSRTADGRRGFRFHDMRHSTASIMAARGERPEVTQRVMRYAKVSFTLDRYVKVYRDDIRDADPPRAVITGGSVAHLVHTDREADLPFLQLAPHSSRTFAHALAGAASP